MVEKEGPSESRTNQPVRGAARIRPSVLRAIIQGLLARPRITASSLLDTETDTDINQ